MLFILVYTYTNRFSIDLKRLSWKPSKTIWTVILKIQDSKWECKRNLTSGNIPTVF